ETLADELETLADEPDPPSAPRPRAHPRPFPFAPAPAPRSLPLASPLFPSPDPVPRHRDHHGPHDRAGHGVRPAEPGHGLVDARAEDPADGEGRRGAQDASREPVDEKARVGHARGTGQRGDEVLDARDEGREENGL